jgi:hypothetical protein
MEAVSELKDFPQLLNGKSDLPCALTCLRLQRLSLLLKGRGTGHGHSEQSRSTPLELARGAISYAEVPVPPLRKVDMVRRGATATENTISYLSREYCKL